MEMAGTHPTPSQSAVGTWLSSSKRGAPMETVSRFHGDGVRYKAKLIGVDTVSETHEKLCIDSMMKLKGFEVAGRRQGRHKQRVWLKISFSGVKILDEKTGDVMYEHERSRIIFLKKDESDPRALAYLYQTGDSYLLFYIKTANLADPVLADITEVCESEEVPVTSPEEPTRTSSIPLVNGISAPPTEAPVRDVMFSPQPVTPSPSQASSSNELVDVFSPQMIDPVMPTQTPGSSQSGQEHAVQESAQPMLSTAQILSMFPTQPAGGAPYTTSPPFSPTGMPWAHQWAGPAGPAGPPVSPSWPSTPNGSVSAWAPVGFTAPPADTAAPLEGVQTPANGFQSGVNMQAPPSADPFNPIYANVGAAAQVQPTPQSNLLM
ncbi:uncharacterized protein V6R79_010952 [Siganus canaliculatus]